MLIDLIAAAAAAPAQFDPQAATRAYLETLQGAARDRSDAYFEGGYWLLLWGALVAVGVSWLVLRLGWSAAWRAWAERITKRRSLRPALYALPFTLATTLIALPWTLYADYFREKQYGLMNLSLPGWLGERAISLGVSLVMSAILLAIVFAVIRKAPRSWWLWGTGTLVAFTAFGVLIAPVFIAPLFNKYTPMAQGALRDQILGMAHANKVPADNVYVFDASKQTKRISANVSGLGPTIRISLNDNLLNRTSPPEVKAVMGHELGHYVLGHVWRLILCFALVFLVGFLLLWWLTPRLLARFGGRWGVRDVADPAVTPLFTAVSAVYLLAMAPVLNSIIRTEESEADAFGLDAAREPDGFAATAMKLSEYRKIDPSPLEEALFFDHPSGRTRVRMAMEWKAKHLAELAPEQRGIVRPQPIK
ncbi:MAG TPA: M48 family metallopeptidase [Allosphingosinicella sp.]|nr:M48 family metallopeptidase [Allosphingosinicella sp.]